MMQLNGKSPFSFEEIREDCFHDLAAMVSARVKRQRKAVPVPADLLIHEVEIGDVQALMSWLKLSNLQSAHMRSAPIYLGSTLESHDMNELREWLAQESHYVWIAERLSDGMAVGTLLLDAAIKKASRCGMTSVSVDFETRNTPAMAFWTRHFTPFTFSVIRCVDGRLFQKGGEA